MKPVLVSHSDLLGGADRAAYRLHCALRQEGIDSSLAVRKKLSRDESVRVQVPRWGRFAPRLAGYIQRLQRSENPVIHSSNLLPTRWSAQLREDVVNLHWIGGDTMSIKDIGRIVPPVVMTLHDMWAFCGAEHYAPDTPDARWVEGYTRDNRPESHHGLDLDRRTWQRKQRHWRPMTVVTPSSWLARCVERSALMSNWPVRVVPNPLDVTTFCPRDPAQARSELGLPADAKVILFGAAGAASDSRKGFDLLVDALRRLAPTTPVLGVIFGQEEPADPPRVHLPLRWMGRIEDEKVLASLYSAADVMVLPSRQENLPQTGTEAQACGTPVVAFDTGGLPDVVVHNQTGYLAEPFSTADLAQGIRWVLEDPYRAAVLRERARRRAVRLWKPSVVTEQYREVYLSALSSEVSTYEE